MTIMKALYQRLAIPVQVLAASLAVGITPVAAAPILAAKSSTTQMRKEQTSKLYFVITAQENMRDIDVSMTPPTGFTVNLETKEVPKELETGSTFTVVYTVTPPGKSGFWEPYSPGSDTREEKTFVFNVGYATTSTDGERRRLHQSVELTVDYSFAPRLYLVFGVIGLVVGGLVKSLTSATAPFGAESKNRDTPDGPSSMRNARAMVGLLANVTVGFIVLLVLSRERIPTKGWYDSLALGIAVAILSDDQLLTKVRGVLPLK